MTPMTRTRLRPLLRRIRGVSPEHAERMKDRILLALGTLHSQSDSLSSITSIHDAEFRVFSQFGEDGIIQYLTRRIAGLVDFFVEIGVEDYRESNTRFLLEKDNWRGVIIDSGAAHIGFLDQRDLRWRHSVDALTAFVEPDNINELLRSADVPQDPGIVSIDIDGMDYWVLEAMELHPGVLIVEYNAMFGPDRSVTVPYEPRFRRELAHYSGTYFGASLAALDRLATERGYRLIGCTAAGNNAFFVRQDLRCPLPALTPREAFVESRFREAKDPHGRLTFTAARSSATDSLLRLPLVEVTTGTTITVSELFGTGT